MVMAALARVWRRGLVGAMRSPWLAVWLWLAELAGLTLALVPVGWLLLRLQPHGRGPADPFEGLAFGWALATELASPTTAIVGLCGFVLAWAGRWLLRSVVGAGALVVLGHHFGPESSAPTPSWSEALLTAPDRALAAGLSSLLLSGWMVLCGLGGLGSAWVWLAHSPGPLPAAAMALSVVLLGLAPLIESALVLGVARAVLRGEGPLRSMGRALGGVLTDPVSWPAPWGTLLGLEGTLSFVTGTATTSAMWHSGLGRTGLGWVAAILLVSSFVLALLSLIRLSLAASVVLEGEGRVEPPTPPPAPVPVPGPVYEAVALAELVEPEDGGTAS